MTRKRKGGDNLTSYPSITSFFSSKRSRGGEKEKEEEANDPKTCGICLMEEGRAVRGQIDCCDHYFCFVCIMEWAKTESLCPMCKQRFTSVRRPPKDRVFACERIVHIPIRDQVHHPLRYVTGAPSNAYAHACCSECQSSEDEHHLLRCDLCNSAAHTHCVGLGVSVPKRDWYCHDCTILRNEYAEIEICSSAGANNSRLSSSTLHAIPAPIIRGSPLSSCDDNQENSSQSLVKGVSNFSQSNDSSSSHPDSESVSSRRYDNCQNKGGESSYDGNQRQPSSQHSTYVSTGDIKVIDLDSDSDNEEEEPIDLDSYSDNEGEGPIDLDSDFDNEWEGPSQRSEMPECFIPPPFSAEQDHHPSKCGLQGQMAYVSLSQGACKKTRGRGPTRCSDIYNQPLGVRKHIEVNEMGQPVGDHVSKLSNYMGTIARDGHVAPININVWRAIPADRKEHMWQMVMDKFDFDIGGKDWVMESLSKKWRQWKSRLKRTIYDVYDNDADRIAHCDSRVILDQWLALMEFWKSPKAEKQCAVNKVNRSKQTMVHTSGTRSFAQVRHEEQLRQGEPPSLADLFIKTHIHKDGRPVNDVAAEKIEALVLRSSQLPKDSQHNIARDDIFFQVMGPERHGRVHGLGLGPTRSSIRSATSNRGGSSAGEREEVLRLREHVATLEARLREQKAEVEAQNERQAQMAAQLQSLVSILHNNSNMRHDPDQ